VSEDSHSIGNPYEPPNSAAQSFRNGSDAPNGPSAPPKRIVVGVGISATSYEAMTEVCRQWILSSKRLETDGMAAPGRYICVTSVHGIVSGVFDPVVRADLNGADAATPDGMPVVWALRSFGVRGQQRVYGPTLMIHLCEMAARAGFGIFLYGASQRTLDRLKENLPVRIPGLRISGSFSPPYRPLTESERLDVQQRIMQSGADLVFVGLSTPRQERWMTQNRAALPGKILVGVGAAFDFHAGSLRQAPAWLQRHGLEWLFRLVMEPRRLWKRYLLVTPLFLPMWAMQKLGILRYSPGALAYSR
jgi:N-acetylglucosaminyldiphosphoundecaprenol N-acetyl-beta-D-mannosaminyltransferase